ncbi:MAG TPA: histidinol-phosphate transaminase [Acidimicrobiales bacterium]|nr:histidinol-phosphate transaminase [Acidimicrobiales bacterium]
MTDPIIAPRDEIASMEGYYSPQIDVEVRLNSNEAPEPPPSAFISRLRGEINEISLNRYPEREAEELRSAVAAHHGVYKEQVYCANGSNEVLQSILLAYGGRDRSVAVFEPTYALHSHIARVTGTQVVTGRRDEEFLVSLEEYDRVATLGATQGLNFPALTFLCSPNNPTGRVEPLETVRAILDRARGLVVVDEAYGQFAPRSAIDLLSKHRNLLIVRTFSKTWSLAALRLGYVVADPEIIDALWRVTLPYHLDAIKQIAGVLAIEYEQEMNERIRLIVAERKRLLGALAHLQVDVVPSDANFILFRVIAKDAKRVWSALFEDSILIRDISTVPYLSGYLRVTIGTPEENDRFLDALTRALV